MHGFSSVGISKPLKLTLESPSVQYSLMLSVAFDTFFYLNPLTLQKFMLVSLTTCNQGKCWEIGLY